VIPLFGITTKCYRMAKNKKQHYVPKSYLKFFSQDGEHLCRYNLKSKDSIRVSINKICQSKYFYGNGLELEKQLSKLEQKHVEILRNLIDAQNLEILTDGDLYHLCSFLLLQYMRTKDEKTMSNKATGIFFSNIVKPLMKSDEDLMRNGITEEFIDSLSITFQGAEHWNMMVIALTEMDLISDLKPILIINKSNRKFICSDAPIVRHNYIKIKNRCMTGFQSPGLQIFCPLNRDILLLLIDTSLYNLELDAHSTIYLNRDSDADSINKLQVFNCLDNIFFSEGDADYVKNLHLEVEDLIKEKEVRLDTLQATQNDDGTYGEIIVVQREGSDYSLKLSFIKLNHKENKRLKRYKKLLKSNKLANLYRNEENIERSESNRKNMLKKLGVVADK